MYLVSDRFYLVSDRLHEQYLREFLQNFRNFSERCLPCHRPCGVGWIAKNQSLDARVCE